MIPSLRLIARRLMATCALALLGLAALAPQDAHALQSTALTAANLQGKTLRFTITGGNAPFETSGAFTIVFGPNNTYTMPISDGNAAMRSGTYAHRADNLATTLTLSGYILNSATVEVSIIHTTNDLRSQFEMFTNGANKHGVVVFDTGVSGAPSVTSATSVTATTGTPFSYTIATNPAATSYTNSGGNAPVSINPTTGIVTGTFTAAGTFTFSFTANNASGSSPVTTVTVTVTAGTGGGATGTVTDDALLPANLVGKTLTFTITSPSNTLNDGPETYRVNFETASFLQRTATGFTWNRVTYGATTALGDGNVRLTTVTTGGAWDNSATGYAAVITLSQTNGVGRFTTRDINNGARANSGTFTISAGDTPGTGGNVAQFAGRYVGQLGSRVGASVNDTLTSYEVIVGATGNVTVTIGSVTGSLIGTINGSGVITFTGGTGLSTFNLRTATITGTSLSSDYNPALGGAQYRFGTSTSFTPATGGAAVGFLSNLSVRAPAGAGDATLIVGVTIGGGSGNKGALIRGVGPALTGFGVAGALADPVLNVYSGSTLVTTNDDWGTEAGVTATGAAVGAFPLTAGSRDAAINATGIAAGSYTIQLTGKAGATGNALVELYDTTPAASITATSSRFTNLSARTFGGTDSQTLIVGFNLAGTSARRLLFRAVGPGLAAFGVGGTMTNPKLELYRGQAKVGENDDWAASTLAAQQSVGAFALTAGSRDAVLVQEVAPGSYTVQVTGGTTGVALVEVYELP